MAVAWALSSAIRRRAVLFLMDSRSTSPARAKMASVTASRSYSAHWPVVP